MAKHTIVYYVIHNEFGYLIKGFNRGHHKGEYNESLAMAEKFATTGWSREHGIDFVSLAKMVNGTMMKVEQEVDLEIVKG